MKNHSENVVLFTYGTMRYGVYNHSRIEDLKASYIGHAETCEPFVMMAKEEPRQIPYVTRVEDEDLRRGQEKPIRGECYLIDRKTLDRVDRAEGHPYYYYREDCHVRLDNGKLVKAVIYLFDCEDNWGNLVASGDFLDFYCEIQHKEQGHFEGKFLDPSSSKPKKYKQPTLFESKASIIENKINSYIPTKYRIK